MMIAGSYTIQYQKISDKSGNQAISSSEALNIEIKDTQAPKVTIYGSNPQYIDLDAIIKGQSTYRDNGAFAMENLYQPNDGLIDWNNDDFSWKLYLREWDFNSSSYGAYQEGELASVESRIQLYIDSNLTDVKRYEITYSMTDKAGNEGNATRVVELQNSPYQFPQLQLVDSALQQLANDGDPYYVELGGSFVEPTAYAFIELGNGSVGALIYTKQWLFDENGQSTILLPSQYDTSKANYHQESGVEYFIDSNGNMVPILSTAVPSS